jgi:hypothetical protein
MKQKNRNGVKLPTTRRQYRPFQISVESEDPVLKLLHLLHSITVHCSIDCDMNSTASILAFIFIIAWARGVIIRDYNRPYFFEYPSVQELENSEFFSGGRATTNVGLTILLFIQ